MKQISFTNTKIDAVFLAGGKGTRIKKILKGKPKPIINIRKKKFLEILISKLSKYNLNKIYILAGYKGDQIYKAFNNKIYNFIKVECLIEKKPLGTGGALNSIKHKLTNNFLVLNADSIFDINLNKFIIHKKKNSPLLALTSNQNYKSNKKLSNLDINSKNIVIKSKSSKKINAGIYFFDKSIFKKLKNTYCSLENDILENEIDKKKVKGYFVKSFFLDIGTYQNHSKGLKLIPKYLKKSAIFLDRDGVINHDYGYVHKLNNFKFKKGVIKALKYINSKNYYLFIVTNQAGIAKKIFSEETFFELQKKIKVILQKKSIFIDDIEYCPHHKEGKIKKYSINCNCRKPKIGMVKKLNSKWFINMNKSYYIGDQKTDELMAKRLGINFYYPEKDLYFQIKKIIKKN